MGSAYSGRSFLLANNDYDFGGETADNAGFRIKARNLTFQALTSPGNVRLNNLGLILDLNVASVILPGGVRTTANSYVTVAYNYFENVWRRSPRAAADGTHVHVFNNLLYRWGYQKDGVTSMPSWNGVAVELDPHQADQPEKVVMAVIQANRYIPGRTSRTRRSITMRARRWDIAKSTTLANRFDKPSGESGNSILEPDGTFQTINVDAWYTGLTGPDGTSLGYVAPPVKPTGEVDWIALARSAGPTMRAAASIPNEVSADPGE